MVPLACYIAENAKIRYDQGTVGALYCSKSKNKVQLEFSSIKNSKVRNYWGFILLKML